MGRVGLIVNPQAGKDIRRLHAPTGHTPDTAKVGIVLRAAIAALHAGAEAILVANDVGRIAARAIRGIDRASLVDGPATGSALDTRHAAAALHDAGCAPIIVLGGDGTCRDVAIGAPAAVLIALSTGTNNAFPRFVDASSAGTAAGLIATGGVPIDRVSQRAKQITITISGPSLADTDIALIDAALIDGSRIGARAVLRSASIRAVLAAVATPASTGLSSVAGRVMPVTRHDDGGVAVWLGNGSRHVSAPIVPGSFDGVAIQAIKRVADGECVVWNGPGVMAYDGERDRVLGPDDTATLVVRRDGPMIVDVDRTLACAVQRRLFDVPAAPEEVRRGD